MAASIISARNHALRLSILLVVASCGGKTTEVADPIPTTLEITISSVAMSFIGQDVPLTARLLDQNGAAISGETFTWLSDDPGVVSVNSSGVVTAVGNGSATVTVTAASLSAMVTAQVTQVPSAVIISGNNQETVAGTALPDPVVARVVDAGAAPVENVTVTFAPDTNHGSVSVASGVSNTAGEVQTVWTLGTFFGSQHMTVSAVGIDVDVFAIARSDTPTPDIAVITPLTLVRADPTTLESFTASVTVRNTGDLTTGAPNTMRLLANGANVGSVTIPTLAPNQEAMLELEAGPLAQGEYAISFVADPDGLLVELEETNNNADGSMTVATQTEVSVPSSQPVAGTAGDELLFRLDVGTTPTNVTIELTGGTGDADLYIDGGNRPSDRDLYAGCVSGSPTTAEECVLVNATGVYHIQVHAFSTFSGTTMTISAGGAVSPYNIELVFIDNGSAAQDQAVRDAAARWESIIVADVPDVNFSTSPIDANACIQGQTQINSTIDDVRIYVVIDSIDGPLGTLAQAGPCVTRSLGNLPIVGTVSFDEADLLRLNATGDMEAVILHEMGHVIGIGTIWGEDFRDLVRNPSLPSSSGVDTHFIGANATDAFDAAGGAGYAKLKVPVENKATAGSSDSHWRESVLDRELMTPALDAGQANPLSAITIQSVKDLGYAVDVSQADAYSVILPAFAGARVIEPGYRLIDLSDDIRTGPIYRVTEMGEIVEIRR